MNMFMYLNVKSLLIELLIINAICSAILVITSKNPVISVIFLISLVLNSALFLIVKGMPFLGISYILVYLGAIIVLFLFVIMMINIKLTDILETGYQYTKNIPLALTVSGLFLYEFFNVLLASSTSYLTNPTFSVDNSIIISLLKEIVLTLNSFFNSILSVIGFYSFTDPTSIEQILASGHHSSNVLPSLGQGIPLITNSIWPETLINNTSSAQQIVSVAYSLYTYGASWFLLLGIILLLAMIAPIYLSRK